MSNNEIEQVKGTIHALRSFASAVKGNRRTTTNFIAQRSFLTQTIQEVSR
jgi:hypothetical protein